mgnify:CR=1
MSSAVSREIMQYILKYRHCYDTHVRHMAAAFMMHSDLLENEQVNWLP